MISTTEAERIILEHFPLLHREECPISEAHGRVLRGDIRADRDLPPSDRVALDGFAVRAADLASGRREFRVQAVQAAGVPPETLGEAADTCVEVMTGAVLPVGADCVVPVEQSRGAVAIGAGGGGGAPGADVVFSEAAGSLQPGHGVHRRASDRAEGAVVVRAGTRLNGPALAAAAACGCAVVTVSRTPTIAVLSTGDELVGVGEPARPWQSRRSNDCGLRASLVAAGFATVTCAHARDDRGQIRVLLGRALAESDVVFITGGVSRGKFDYLPEELERQGVRPLFHGVAQRPGKPFWFGVSGRLTPVFALPGNPVSAFTCLHRYGLPALAAAGGWAQASPRVVTLAAAYRSASPELTRFVPVRIAEGRTGGSGPTAVLSGVDTSGDVGALAGSDGFVELPGGAGQAGARFLDYAAGTAVTYRPWL